MKRWRLVVIVLPAICLLIVVGAFERPRPMLAASTDSISSPAAAGGWVSYGPLGSYVFGLAIDPVSPTMIYAGTAGRGVFKSTDGGASWLQSNTGMGDVSIRAVAINPLTSSLVYAGPGFYRSSDGGAHWVSAQSGLTNTGVNAIVVNPITPTTLFVGTGGGVFKSGDGGASWTPKNAGLVGLDIAAVTRDTSGSTDNWYVTTGSSLYVSTNGVESWTLVNNYNAGTVGAAAINLPYGYVGTQTQGVFIRLFANVYVPLIMR